MTAPRRLLGTSPPGRLPAAVLRALAAELSDPGRFGRAKAYARDGAVIDIEVDPGEVTVEIRGSRFEPYQTRVWTAPADGDATPIELVPDRDELAASCTCPDDAPYDGGFCKHALAALLVLADEVTVDPGLLTTWRSGPARPDLPAARLPAAAASPTGGIDELSGATNAPARLPRPPDLPPHLPVAMAPGDDALADVLADALAVLRRH